MGEFSIGGKAEVFNIGRRSFWREYGTKMKKIDALVQDQGKSRKFAEFWLDVQTDGSVDTGKRPIPDSAQFDMFERSFEFFSSDSVSPLTLQQLANLQLNALTSLPDSELKSACEGIWAYYLFPEKFSDLENEDDLKSKKTRKISSTLRRELKRFLDDMMANKRVGGSSGDEANHKKMFYLSLLENFGDKMYPETENMEYFAKLYAHDEDGPADLQTFDHRRSRSQNEPAGPSNLTGVEQPGHVRSYLFESDRLPSADTLGGDDDDDVDVEFFMVFEDVLDEDSGGRVDLALTPDRKLPMGLLRLFRDSMLLTRAGEDYRRASAEEKKALRITAVREFINQILKPSAAMKHELESYGLDPDKLQHDLAGLARANKGQTPHLIWTKRIN